MASGYQSFICVGNLTKDVETRNVGENEVAKFSVAVNGYRDSVEYFDVEHWNPGKVTMYLTRGTPVLVDGELQTQRWEKDGQQRSKIVVKARRIQLLGGGKKKEHAEEEMPEFAADFR